MFQTIQHFTESSLEVPNLIQLFSHYTCLKLLKARSRDDSFFQINSNLERPIYWLVVTRYG